MSKLFYKHSQLIGIEIGTKDIKAMSVNPDNWSVFGYGAVDVDEDKMKQSLEKLDDDYLETSLTRLLKSNIVGKTNSKEAIINVPTSYTYVRTFTLPIEAKKNLQEAIELEVSQYIPVAVPLLFIDYEIIKETKEDLTITVAACPRGVIENSLNACENIGLTVLAAEPKINSVARIIGLTEQGELTTAIIDISQNNTDIAILSNNIVRLTGSIAVGGNNMTADIAKNNRISLEKAHQLKTINGLNPGVNQSKIKTATEPTLKQIIKELNRVIRYYNERISDEKIEQILIVGGGANLPGIGDYFTNALIMPARVASPWHNLDFGKLQQPNKQYRPHFISVAGLAITSEKEIWS